MKTGRIGRPVGSGVFDETDVQDALKKLGRDKRRWRVAMVIGISEAGLASHHRRRGFTWRDYVDHVQAREGLGTPRKAESNGPNSHSLDPGPQRRRSIA